MAIGVTRADINLTLKRAATIHKVCKYEEMLTKSSVLLRGTVWCPDDVHDVLQPKSSRARTDPTQYADSSVNENLSEQASFPIILAVVIISIQYFFIPTDRKHFSISLTNFKAPKHKRRSSLLVLRTPDRWPLMAR